MLFKILLILNEGLIFSILAIGVYISFQWLRFPDLTPDGSFVLGAIIYVKCVYIGISPPLALICSGFFGAMAGAATGFLTRIIGIPSVVSGLLISSSLYSVNWLILGKPNQFLDPNLTLVGDISGMMGSLILFQWIAAILCIVCLVIGIFSSSVWGLRLKAIGENPLLAHDIGESETTYTFFGLTLANSLVGVAGALFSQRSFSADINMGIGVTISGLVGVILGLLFVGQKRDQYLVFLAISLASILHKAAIYFTLELGLPAESFRLVSSLLLITIFLFARNLNTTLLKGLKWN
jgi:putative ABC transport system permease protein